MTQYEDGESKLKPVEADATWDIDISDSIIEEGIEDEARKPCKEAPGIQH